jgi:D-tyrosyl-tRNA(Tyr) deacylase
MKIVLQRVKSASVSIEGKNISAIGKGYILMLGIAKGDSEKDIDYLADKVINLRLFENAKSKFDKDLKDVRGEILVISQFTLFADTRKGRRPSFTKAETLKRAKELYEKFILKLKESYDPDKVKAGVFAAKMLVEISNEGPVTIILDSKKYIG